VADVGIGKTAVQASRVGGEQSGLHDFSVTNFGPSSASGVVVTDSLARDCDLRECLRWWLEQQRYRELEPGHLGQWSDQQCHRDRDGPASGSLTNMCHGEHFPPAIPIDQ
jgi:hypothetical protein